jgi:putative hydrolase of the HAD superfamily
VPEYEQGVLGWVTFDDWCHATERALANDHGTDAARIAVGAWHAGRGAIDRRVVDVITSVHRQVPVGLLSNAHDCLPRDLETHGLAGLFDEVVCSYAVHLAKPEPAIFACAARAFGVPPATCFFTDDLQPNVAAARAVGMRSHRFSGIEGLMVALTGAGIRVAPDT